MRSLPEWIGKNDDERAPIRVQVRVFDRCEGKCGICGRKIHAGESWTLEHVKAICNGGANAEHNLGVTCSWCLQDKNADDVAEKSAIYRKRAKHIGALKPKRKFGAWR